MTVGVSPQANIFGMKVLDDTGDGEASDVIGALDLIVEHRTRHGNPPRS